nr:potassium channel subfamily K member 3-like [Danaus plexippus plexippus]
MTLFLNVVRISDSWAACKPDSQPPITPLSPKWRYAIEKRIEDERQLTIEAMAEGARLKPGQFWNLPGTFLFTIYVMTALGFGAPVPHTLWGRTSALIYALLAVPTHIYLMVNASTYFVVRLDEYTMYLRENCCRKFYSNTENTQG